MRSRIIVAAALAALVVALPSHTEAQTDDHPIVGTWRLNLETSSFDPGPGPQAIQRSFGVDEDGFLVSVRATLSPTGNPDFAMTRAKLDGGDYVVWTTGGLYSHLRDGAEPGSTASFEEIDGRTLRLTQKNGEGVVNPLSPNMWEVSSDGSTLTVTTTGTTADDVQVHRVEVYDRVPG